MSEQSALFGITVPPDVKLGPRQWAGLEALKDGPLSSADLGVRIHKDSRSRICDYCQSGLDCFYAEADGAHVAASLRSHGLTKFSRRRGVWYLVELGLPPEPQSRPDDPIPF